MPHPTVRALPLALLALAGCASSDDLLIDGPMASVAVHGQVTRSDGTPAEGVRVEVEIRGAQSCQASGIANAVETDAEGRYLAWAGNWGERFTSCLLVRAVPPAGSGLAADSVIRADVELRAVRPDSLELDFALAPR